MLQNENQLACRIGTESGKNLGSRCRYKRLGHNEMDGKGKIQLTKDLWHRRCYHTVYGLRFRDRKRHDRI